MAKPVIYAFSGLGADERVFDYLDLDNTLISIKWLPPFKDEPIEKYALRIFDKVDTTKPFYLMGVSFGGLIAVELSKVLKPIGTILVSSVEVRADFRKIYLTIGRTGLLKNLPVFIFGLKPWLANIIFGAKNKMLLREILLDTDPHFVRWAIGQLTTWKNEIEIKNCYKLNGDHDLMIPHRSNRNQIIVEGGAHFMIIDRASEVSTLINTFLNK